MRRPSRPYPLTIKIVLALAGVVLAAIAIRASRYSGGAFVGDSNTYAPMARQAETVSTATPTGTPLLAGSASSTATLPSGSAPMPPAAMSSTSTPIYPAASTSPMSAMPSPTPSPVTRATPLLGVQALGVDGQAMRLAASAGAKWVRLTIKWSDVEQTRGSYNFADSDRVFTAVAGEGLTPIVEIRGNPSWAATTVCGRIDKAGGLDAFGALIRALVARYSGASYNVKHWELYNEPDNTNVDPFGPFLGGCWGAYPGDYVAMLEKARTNMDEVDPNAKIVVGGLARDAFYHNGQQIFNLDFPGQVFDAGGARYIDVMNIHYFSTQAPNWSSYGPDIGGKVEALRTVMRAHGVDKPLMVTEVNWTQGFAGAYDTWSAGQLAEFSESQARYLPKAFARGAANRLYAITWFALQDFPGADLPYGLLDSNGQARPAYNAFKTAAVEIGQTDYLRPLRASEVGAAGGLEGYVFASGGEQRWVLWATGDTVSITLPGSTTMAEDKLGGSIALSGGGAPTNLTLTASPIFTRLN